MIRFVDLGTQIGPDNIDWDREFAFFDTITDRFLDFRGKQVWDSWGDLEDDLKEARREELVPRLKRLCPPWVFKET